MKPSYKNSCNNLGIFFNLSQICYKAQSFIFTFIRRAFCAGCWRRPFSIQLYQQTNSNIAFTDEIMISFGIYNVLNLLNFITVRAALAFITTFIKQACCAGCCRRPFPIQLFQQTNSNVALNDAIMMSFGICNVLNLFNFKTSEFLSGGFIIYHCFTLGQTF